MKQNDIKKITLGNKQYFELIIGKRRLQSQLYRSNGTIPVYSGNVTIPFGYVDEPIIINDFDHDYIIWGIDDANFDFGFITKGTKFDITDHCGAIKILDKDIIPEYLFYELQLIKKDLRFNWSRRPNLGEMSNVTVNIPLKADNTTFDNNLQKIIAKKFSMIRETKEELKNIKDYIKKVEFEISDEEIGKHIRVSLNDEKLFRVNNGERIRKEDIEKVKGDIPVYSSSKFEEDVLGNVSEIINEIIPKASFFNGTNLTVSADGSVGSVFVRKGQFYANDVCNVVTILHHNIDAYFVKYELRTQIYEMRLDWTNKLYKQKLKTIFIRIPINEKGEFDLVKQRMLVEKFSKSEEIRNMITEEIDQLAIAEVKLS